MRRSEESSRDPPHPSSHPSEPSDNSEEEQLDELSADDPKIEELQGSLERLREFVEGLAGGSVTSVPACVADYCDKMEEYRVRDADSVLRIA